MSNIYDEFMSNYNKLAEINNKPLIKEAEELPMIDPSEGMPEDELLSEIILSGDTKNTDEQFKDRLRGEAFGYATIEELDEEDRETVTDLLVDDYTNYDVSTPSDKMQSVGAHAALEHVKEAVNALDGTEDSTLQHLSQQLNEIKGRLMLKVLGGSE